MMSTEGAESKHISYNERARLRAELKLIVAKKLQNDILAEKEKSKAKKKKKKKGFFARLFK